MNLLVFLGAGVSVPSGLPTAAELTKTVLTAPYRELGRGRFQSGRRPLSEPRSNDTTPRIKRYLRLLLRHDLRDISRVGASPKKGGHKASGAIFRGNTTYEDLYFLSQQLGLWNIGLSDSSLTTPFMEALEKKAGDLLRGRTKIARLSDLASLGEQACWYIETVVADTLRRGQPKGMDLLRELVGTNEIDRLEIVTLNHDTLVEQFLTSNGIEYADGFGAMDGDVRIVTWT